MRGRWALLKRRCEVWPYLAIGIVGNLFLAVLILVVMYQLRNARNEYRAACEQLRHFNNRLRASIEAAHSELDKREGKTDVPA